MDPTTTAPTQTDPNSGGEVASAAEVGGQSENVFTSFLDNRKSAEAKSEAKAPEQAKAPAEQNPEAKVEAKATEPKKDGFDFAKKEAKKAEAPKADAKPEEAAKPADQPKDKDYNWKQVNQERDTLKARVAELETKLKTPQVDEASKKVFEKMQEENKQLKEIVNRVALKESPEFKARFDKSIERIANLARAAVPSDLQEQVAKVFKDGKFGDDLQGIIDQIDPSAASKLRALEARVNETLFERDEYLQNASKNAEEYAAQEQMRRAAAVEAEKKQAAEMFDSAWGMAAENLELLKVENGNPEQAEVVKSIRKSAEEIWNGQMPAKELAKVSVWAALGPHYREAMYTQMQLNSKLQDEINSLKALKPDPTKGGGQTSTANSGQADAAAAFLSRI